MPTATRKQRELQAREELILDHASELLEVHGYLGLNLDELARRIEYAKGTIYLHFGSKEDVLLGVVIRGMEERARLFRHAARFPGRTREKCCAIGIADLILNERQPHAFEMVQLVSTASVWEKTSELRRSRLQQANLSIVEPVLAVVREAQLAGDIRDSRLPAEQIALGLLTMSKGAMLIAARPDSLPPGAASLVMSSLQQNRHFFLDGAGWHPLSTEHDYAPLEARLRAEYFAAA